MSNLHRQIAHATSRVGWKKVDSLAHFLHDLNPLVRVATYPEALGPANAARTLAPYDLVLDCSDNAATRYLVSDACVVLGKPLVSAAALRVDGQLAAYNAPPVPQGVWADAPCYRCQFPRPLASPSCGEAGILGPVVGIMGTMQALEAIKLLTAGLHRPRHERHAEYFAMVCRFAVAVSGSDEKDGKLAHLAGSDYDDCAASLLGNGLGKETPADEEAGLAAIHQADPATTRRFGFGSADALHAARLAASFRLHNPDEWNAARAAHAVQASPPPAPQLVLCSADLKTGGGWSATPGPDPSTARSPLTVHGVHMRARRHDCPACGLDAHRITTLERLRAGACAVAVETCAAPEAATGGGGISVREYQATRAKRDAEPHVLVDVRTPELFSVGSIAGAVNVPIDVVRAAARGRVAAHGLPWQQGDAKGRPVYVVCRTGIDSLEAAALLRAMDEKDGNGAGRAIESIRGGISAWSRQVDPSVDFI